MSDYCIVLNTCPSPEVAEQLAARLVELGLAVCVNIVPGVRSIYRWQGKKEIADEQLLIIKTRSDRYSALEVALCELHPYELPEIISVPITRGLPGYLAWIDGNLALQK